MTARSYDITSRESKSVSNVTAPLDFRTVSLLGADNNQVMDA